jgi:pectate lyase
MNTKQTNLLLKRSMLILGMALIYRFSFTQHVGNPTDMATPNDFGVAINTHALATNFSNTYPITENLMATSANKFIIAADLGDNLSVGADADGTSKGAGSYGSVIDGDQSTYWSPSSTTDERISVKWKSSPATLNTVIIKEPTNSVTNWSLVNNDNGNVLATGTTLGSSATITFDEVTLSKINLVIHNASSIPRVTEFETYYASGSGTDYTVSTSVNGSGSVSGGGTYVAGSSITLTATPSSGWQFDSWSGDVTSTNQSLSLTVNSNLSITANFSEVSSGNTTITIQENETGFCDVDGIIETEHNGYTGSGYANTDNATGTGIDYKVNVLTAGTYSFEIRYAATSDRPANLLQNGSVVASNVALPSSGAWTTYATVTTSAYLNAGSSDLRLEATSSDGLPNIDYLKISGSSISAESCSGTPGTYTLNVSVSPTNAGYVTLSPSGGTYSAGTNVTLTAVPNTNYSFSSWTGISGSATTTITVNSNLNITANFVYSGSGGDDADFALVGYATQNGGTTGGSGGTVVYASSGDQIRGYIDQKKDGAYSNGLVIIVNGTIRPSNTSATKIDVKEVRDVSIIGSGTSGEFNGIGIKVYRAGNVILRNLRIHHVDIGDKDCISIEGPADHIWVDHCEIYNEYGDNVDKDYYDGLLDAKAESEYITYSWNYLHDSWKTMLVGSSDGDNHDRKITAHHNIFEHCNSRMPLYRFGTGHFFNNYYVDGASTAINSRMGACLRIENNYFENVQNPYVSAYSDEDGYGDIMNNILDNCSFVYSSDVHELQSCSSSVPYNYQDVLNSAASIPSITRQYSGVGKLSDPTSYITKSTSKALSVVNKNETIVLEAYPNPFSESTTITLNLTKDNVLSFRITDMTGRLVDQINNKYYHSGQNTIKYNNPGLKPGIYIVSVYNGTIVENKRLIIE